MIAELMPQPDQAPAGPGSGIQTATYRRQNGMTLYSKIIGTGSYLPPRRVTNQELSLQLAEKGIETSDEWIVSRSGISARHYADPDMQSSDMAVIAARRALEMAGCEPNDVDLIMLATVDARLTLAASRAPPASCRTSWA